MLSPEELLQKRYKVIAPWPCCPYSVGDLVIINKTLFMSNETGDQSVWEPIEHISAYPTLITELPWYACRKVNDMPRYVKWAQSNPVQVAEVVQWDMEGAMFPTCLIKGECHMRCVVECDLLPATFDEYITYIKR